MIDRQTYVWYPVILPEREKIKYTVNRYVILGWSMHDDAPGPLKGVSHIRASDNVSSERWIAATMCNEARDDNDTPVQSQPCREAGSRNEGGFVRTTEELDPREAGC